MKTILNQIKLPLIIAALVLLSNCTEDNDYCETIFNQREELEKDLDDLNRLLKNQEIDQETFDEEYQQIWTEIYVLEENNPDCYY